MPITKRPGKIAKKVTILYKSGFIVLAIALIGVGLTGGQVFGQTLQQQINQLQTQNQAARQNAAALDVEAADLQGTVDALQEQVNVLQNHINELIARRNDLQNQILTAETELAKQQAILAKNIRTMYIESDMSTMEMLLTSNDLSDYLDKEQYRSVVRDKIKDTLDTINALKAQLTSQKAEQEQLLAEQQAAQDQLLVQRGEHQRLLNLNQAEQNSVDAAIKSNNDRIAQLRKQQAAENARLIRSNGGSILNVPDTTGYPWANVQPFPNSFPDPWGMYKRQCVSYTAWKVFKDGKKMPYWGGRGNAKNWPANARKAGIPVSSTPKKGDIAISTRGTYGHAMYVEEVLSNGKIRISQYNASWDGRYSEATISPNGLEFIHF